MTEYRTLLSNFIKKSATVGLLKNDGTVDTTDYVSTSNTEGLIKNDGTIDTTTYLSAHQDITGKEDKFNKVTSLSSSSTDTQYPSAKAVNDNLNLKVDKQEDSLITVTNGNIILSDYHTKDRWTNEGASGGGITSTTLTSGSQGIAFYVYNFPSSVTSVTIQFRSNANGSYVSNSGGADGTPIDTSQNGTTFTATSDDGLCIKISSANTQVTYTVTSITFNMNNWIDKIYPIGATYISTVEIEPSTLFGGVWERIKDRFLLSSGDTYANATTGGSATVTLTSAQSGVPAHSHKYQDYNTTYTLKTTNRKPGTSTAVAYGTSLTAGGGATERTSSNNTAANASQAHENMPPYVVVYMWKRIG